MGDWGSRKKPPVPTADASEGERSHTDNGEAVGAKVVTAELTQWPQLIPSKFGPYEKPQLVFKSPSPHHCKPELLPLSTAVQNQA